MADENKATEAWDSNPPNPEGARCPAPSCGTPAAPIVPPLNIVSEDCYGCCGALRKELRANPELEQWTCAKCGLPWKPRIVDGVRLWEAKPVFLAIRRR